MSKLLEARWISLDPQTLEELTGGLLSTKLSAGSGLAKTANGLVVFGVTNAMLAGGITLSKLVKGGVIALTDEVTAIQELWSFPDGVKTPEINSSKIVSEVGLAAAFNEKNNKNSVKGVAETNLTLANDPGTVDGVSYTDSDRILLVGQTDQTENGIWIVSTTSSWARPADFATDMAVASAFTISQKGTANAETLWLCAADTGSDVVDTDPLTWVIISRNTAVNSYEQDFSSGDLSSGILVINHKLGKKLVNVVVADTAYQDITPDSIVYTDPDNCTLDLTSSTVTGTWHLSVTK